MRLLKERILFALIEMGASQVELAKACGINPVSVNDWISGKTQSLKYKTAVRAAAFLKVRIEWLTENKGPMRDGIAQPLTANYVVDDPIDVDLSIINKFEADAFRAKLKSLKAQIESIEADIRAAAYKCRNLQLEKSILKPEPMAQDSPLTPRRTA